MKSFGFGLVMTIVMTFLLPVSSYAQSNPCTADYKKYCTHVKPGGGRILKCLNSHADKINPSCSANVSGLLACGADQKKYCAGVNPANWGLQKCMEKNISSLTPSCAKTVTYYKQFRKG